MLNWLNRFLHSIEQHLPSPVRSAIEWSVSAIGGILGTITNDVTTAWKDLTGNFAALEHAVTAWVGALQGKLEQVILHWIPHFAITAWWWVTNPQAFAQKLLYHLVAALEKYAWTVARYLGTFLMALIHQNLRQLVAVLEQILAAIL